MAVITGSEYRKIAVEYASARDRQLAMKQDFFDAVYIVVLLQVIVPEVDLLNNLWGNYLVNTDTINSNENFLSAVRTVQNHVVARSDFTTIDAYLVDQGITVPQGWADLSALVGFNISSSNVDP